MSEPRRWMAVAGAAVVAVLGLVAIATGPGLPSADGPADEATPTPSASPSAARLPDALRQLPADSPPAIDWAVGNVIHRGAGGEVTLPEDWKVVRLAGAAAATVVEAATPAGRVVALVTGDGSVTELSSDAPFGAGVDPTGTMVAWGSSHVEPAQERLTVMDLDTREVIRTAEVDQPARVEAWVTGEGPLFSYAVDPGGPPLVLAVDTGEIRSTWTREMPGGEPTFAAYSASTRTLALAVAVGNCVLLRGPAVPRGLRDDCLPGRSPADFRGGAGDAERLVATTDGMVTVFRTDSTVQDRNPLPAGSVVDQQEWEQGGSRLVVISTDQGTTHVLRCAGSGECARAYDSAPGQVVVLLRD